MWAAGVRKWHAARPAAVVACLMTPIVYGLTLFLVPLMYLALVMYLALALPAGLALGYVLLNPSRLRDLRQWRAGGFSGNRTAPES